MFQYPDAPCPRGSAGTHPRSGLEAIVTLCLTEALDTRRFACILGITGAGNHTSIHEGLPVCAAGVVRRRGPERRLRPVVYRSPDSNPFGGADTPRPAHQRHADEPADGVQLRAVLYSVRVPHRPSRRFAVAPQHRDCAHLCCQPADPSVFPAPLSDGSPLMLRPHSYLDSVRQIDLEVDRAFVHVTVTL